MWQLDLTHEAKECCHKGWLGQSQGLGAEPSTRQQHLNNNKQEPCAELKVAANADGWLECLSAARHSMNSLVEKENLCEHHYFPIVQMTKLNSELLKKKSHIQKVK